MAAYRQGWTGRTQQAFRATGAIVVGYKEFGRGTPQNSYSRPVQWLYADVSVTVIFCVQSTKLVRRSSLLHIGRRV